MATHTIYHALGQKSLMFGCDRELFMLNLLICAALIFCSMSFIVSLLVGAVGVLVIYLLRLMGDKDGQMRHVYIRSLRYRRYYLATATILSNATKRYP